jgi:PAS domain S-box-containing protein
MWNPPRSALLRYTVAALLVAVALLLTLEIRLLIDTRNIYFFFALAVLLGAWQGGLGAGLFATALAAVAGNFFLIPPYYSFHIHDPGDLYHFVLFVFEGGLLSVLTATLGSPQQQMVRNPLFGYPLAAGVVLAAVMLKLSLLSFLTPWPHIDTSTQFALFYAAVLLSAWAGGLGPGLWAVGLAALASNYFFTEPHYALAIASAQDAVRLALFVAEGTAITLLSTTIHTAWRQAEEHAKQVRLAEDALRASELRLRSVLESAPDAIVIADSNGLILSWNPGAQAVFGYVPDEVLGKSLAVLMPPRFHDAFRAGLERHRTTGTAEMIGKMVEFPGVRKNGQEFPLEISVATWRTAEGTFYSGILRDVSERQHLEEQLRQAQKMETVGRLAAGVAHDFNNLLMAVLGYSELTLRKLAPDDPLRGDLLGIIEVGERTATLTRQLLSFSRKQAVRPQVLDLHAVVATVSKMLRRLIGEDVELETRTDAVNSRVRADPGQLEQVLLNLAVNARDAMPQGGRLRIETDNVYLDEAAARARPEARTGAHVVLTVTDTGCGMPPEVQAHLFEPFFTTKETGKGTGLGLATVHGIVKQSGGHIAVESAVGRGTTFRIYLPAADPDTAGSPTPAATAPGGTETVLLVEDEDVLRPLFRRMLQDKGYQVLEARNGSDALQIASSHAGPIHLLLTDVVLPQMNGREVAERLTALRPGLRVLFMSGYASEKVFRHGVVEEGTAFLQKPFREETLARKVREVLDR